jgi:CDGSH-type Zn-finger protein
MDYSLEPGCPKRIEICSGGPYIVTGNIPLVRKIQIVSEYGEPLSWKKEGKIATDEGYFLCRCGQSCDKPFCDGTHAKIGFDGTETAPATHYKERKETYPGSKKIAIHLDESLCSDSGFCANRMTNIAEMAAHTDDTQVRALAIAMIEHCPSGALTYSLDEEGVEIEVDLPQQIAVTTEITSEAAILGPLWVTGGITIIRSDGQVLETRNRVTLCNCGLSKNKPFCDGTHRDHPIMRSVSFEPAKVQYISLAERGRLRT